MPQVKDLRFGVEQVKFSTLYVDYHTTGHSTNI